MSESKLDQAIARVAEATEKVEAQRDILRRLKDMHGDPTRATQLLSALETELSDAQNELAALRARNSN